jgi:PIN domain nuclease of toxin-antitoxin system
MNYLLDTSTFIWVASEPQYLSKTAAAITSDRNHTLFLSIVSVWEMQIKIQAGKMTLPLPLFKMVRNQRRVNQLQILPLKMRHIAGLSNLPNIHKDPFDRLLIAQASVENIAFISSDAAIAQYPITVIW